MEAKPAQDYEQGWNALNELIRSDGTWSGYERNVFYANNRDGTFSDVSGAVGMDFVEDGRSFALSDFDHDGRLEVFLEKPQRPAIARLEERDQGSSAVDFLPPRAVARVTGTPSAPSITVETESGRQTRFCRPDQDFFPSTARKYCSGSARPKVPVQASIRWPSGLVQKLHDLPLNHRVWVEEGSETSRIEAFKASPQEAKPVPARLAGAAEAAPLLQFPTKLKPGCWRLFPRQIFLCRTWQERPTRLKALRGKPVLLNFWTRGSTACEED